MNPKASKENLEKLNIEQHEVNSSWNFTLRKGIMKTYLLETAGALQQPQASAVLAFSRKKDQLAAQGNQSMAERADLEKLIGKNNQQMAEDNNRNFARFMESVFTSYHPEVLVETVLWVFRTYRAHGFHATYWAANLNVWVEMLKKELQEDDYNSLYPFYNWLIIHIPICVKLTDQVPGKGSSDARHPD